MENQTNRTIIQAYIIGSLWIDKKESAAEALIKKNVRTIDFYTLFFIICKDYAICKLGECQENYPYSELIYEEKERICSKNTV